MSNENKREKAKLTTHIRYMVKFFSFFFSQFLYATQSYVRFTGLCSTNTTTTQSINANIIVCRFCFPRASVSLHPAASSSHMHTRSLHWHFEFFIISLFFFFRFPSFVTTVASTVYIFSISLLFLSSLLNLKPIHMCDAFSLFHTTTTTKLKEKMEIEKAFVFLAKYDKMLIRLGA